MSLKESHRLKMHISIVEVKDGVEGEALWFDNFVVEDLCPVCINKIMVRALIPFSGEIKIG